MVKKKQITTEDLAIMVQGGFSEMREYMDKRFDRIENILFAGHDRRIERLEDGMRLVKTSLKIKG